MQGARIDVGDERLEPCPFCGTRLLSCYGPGRAVRVICIPCSADGPIAEDPEKAIELWNRRPMAPAGQEHQR